MLTTQDRILIETRIGNEGPSVVVAYLLWFFLGFFSAHRFYLGKPGTAVLQIVLCFVLVGIIWVLFDIFMIPGMVRKRQNVLRERLSAQFLAVSSSDARVALAPPR